MALGFGGILATLVWLGFKISLSQEAERGHRGHRDGDQPVGHHHVLVASVCRAQRIALAALAIFLMLNAVTPFITPDPPWLANLPLVVAIMAFLLAFGLSHIRAERARAAEAVRPEASPAQPTASSRRSGYYTHYHVTASTPEPKDHPTDRMSP